MKNVLLTTALLGMTSVAMAEDRFADIRPIMNTCAACHGPQGQGGIGPKLQGQSADDIIGKLLKYKAGKQVGPQSMLMWGTAKGLTEGQIGAIGVYISQGYPNE